MGSVAFVAYVTDIERNLPDINNSSVFNIAQNSRIYASDKTTVLAELQIENREPVSSLDVISKDVKDATISVEDARFYQHKGFDFFGMLRAFIVNATGGATQGGSTITMQLMRNTILTKEAQTISIERKITEILLSTRIEKIYSKDEILLMYLNTINYGDGCYGIKAAAKHYFSKEPAQLNLNESATLAGIPQSPTYLSPTNNLEACTKRRNLVLQRMFEDHLINQEQIEQTKITTIPLNVSYNDLANNYKYPYFTNYVRELIMEKYTKAEIFEGGFQIYSTLDIKHQEACEQGCDTENKKLEKDAEAVAVTINPGNGFITGMVGGKDFNTNQYNICTSKGRPTGSSFKAFTLIAAIEAGYNPNSYSIDCSGPLNISSTSINNFGNSSYGYRTIQGAIAISSNTGLVRLQQKVGTQKLIETAQKLGIKKADLPSVQTLTLGVADINPLEMASAYATVANGGIYHEPQAIMQIETASGDEIYNFEKNENLVEGERVLSPDVASAATSVLKTVFTQGTATSAQLNNGQVLAGKTGTSEDYRDHTLIGYTPNLVLATWIGKRNYQPTSSSVTCNALFKNIMTLATNGEPNIDFPKIPSPQYNQKKSWSWNDDKLFNAKYTVGMTIAEAKNQLKQYSVETIEEESLTSQPGIVINQCVENGKVILYVAK